MLDSDIIAVYNGIDSKDIANDAGGHPMKGLTKFRNSKGLSQEKMAQQLGVSFSMYSKVENGAAKPSRNFMMKIKKTYPDANIDELFFTVQQQ